MKRGLQIADGVSLPSNLSTQSITVLAKRRVGKSYTMRKIWEELLKTGQQVVTIDPKGDQWGIRSSADGKRPGFSVLILGGEHGDLPLEKESGELIAKLVVEQQVNVLLDTSHFSKSARAVFMAAFLENLYRLKAQEKYRTPLCVIIDEADEIAPQNPQKDEYRMLGAIDDIVRRGGQRGLGSILITQRSASLNKNVLTQSEMLILLRTIAPQDLAAVKAWIDVHGTPEQRAVIMSDLPSLPRGDAYFWSPAWPTDEGMFKRAHVLPIETFDSAKTPEVGEKRIIPKNLADIDLNALKGQMSATIEKVKNDDPRLLRARIAELEKIQKTPAIGDFSQKNVESAVKDALLARDREWQTKVFDMQGEWLEQIKNWYEIMAGIAEAMKKARQEFPQKYKLKMTGFRMTPEQIKMTSVGVRPGSAQTGSTPHEATTHHKETARHVPSLPTDAPENLEAITEPEQRVLDGIAWMENIGVKNPAKEIVAFLARYAHIRSKGFTNPCGSLRAKGCVEYLDGGRIALTDTGRAIAKFPDGVGTTEDLHRIVLDRLDEPKRRVLKPLLDVGGSVMSNADLCTAASYMHERSKGYTNPRGALRSYGLIEYVSGGVKAADILFL